MRLFDMINDLPAIHEIVSGTAKKQVKRIKLAPNPGHQILKGAKEVRSDTC
ncbi:hypothetical protein LguiB_031876 [Lonicera macranthoides]